MDEKVLKWSTGVIVLATILFLVGVFYLPSIHERSVLIAQENYDPVEEVVIAASSADLDMVEEEGTGSLLSIELPEGVTFRQVTFEQDYLNQMVYLRIPSDSKDYFADYKVKGSCNHVKSISYYREADQVVIAVKTDMVVESSTIYDEQSVFLEFVDPHDLYDKVVVIDAGHGGRDGGASRLGVKEKDLNLAMLLAVKELLEEDSHIKAYYTRTEDVATTLDQRVQLANKAHADLFISIHNNSISSGMYSGMRGTQVMYSESDDSELSSKKFAGICKRNVIAACKSKDQGLIKGDKIYIIRTSQVPVALIEVGFMTNRDELLDLGTEEYQEKVAQGIYNAILEAFEEGY